jgi:hypothetical protein
MRKYLLPVAAVLLAAASAQAQSSGIQLNPSS